MRRVIWIATLFVVVAVAPASAQSHFGVYGLGSVLSPLDARSRALGGVGVGLLGLNTSMVNPAEISGLRGRAFFGAAQPSSRRVQLDDESERLGTMRFPLMRMVQPMGSRVNLTVGYGGVLDQSFALVTEAVEVLNGDTVGVRDELATTGGLAQFRAGGSYSVLPTLALGVELGVYTGERRRELKRTLGGEEAGYGDFSTLSDWRFRGPLAVVGFRWDPVPLIRLAGSLNWSGRLEAEGVTAGTEDRRFRMPLQVAAGASGLLAPGVRAGLSGSWVGWSVMDADLYQHETARDTWAGGFGVEWDAVAMETRDILLRAGVHMAQLPFSASGSTATERVLACGGGVRLLVEGGQPRATFDGSLEIGSRSQDGDPQASLTETFWRVTFSMALFGP